MTTLRTIRARLERWELQHLREHCAQLAQRLEDLELDVTREAGAADHWRNQCQALIEDLQDAAQEVGLTVDGELGAINPMRDFSAGSINAQLATAIIDEAIEFMEGFRDDSMQELDINARLDNLIGLRNTVKGGAA